MLQERSILDDIAGLGPEAMASAAQTLAPADVLHRVFGFAEFRGTQEQVVDRVLADHDGDNERMQAAADNENKGQSQFYIRVTPEITGAPDLSWWRITWQREGDAWTVALIEPKSGTAIDTLR